MQVQTMEDIRITDHAIQRWNERPINTDIKEAIEIAVAAGFEIKKNQQVLLNIEGTTDIFVFKAKRGQMALVTVENACNMVRGRKIPIRVTGNHKDDEENILMWMKEKKAIHKKNDNLDDIFFIHTPDGMTKEVKRFSNRASF